MNCLSDMEAPTSLSTSADLDHSGPIGDGEYEVQEGDCIESLAARYGHHWQTVWNHPRNAALKAARGSPNILLPGDLVHIPPLRPGQYSGATEKRHRFVLRGRSSKLRLRVLECGKPRANEPYRLTVDNRIYQGTTDADGNIEVSIPPAAIAGELIVGIGQVRQRVYPLRLGGMDPIASACGVQKRLRNLGIHCPLTGRMDDETTSALAVFQSHQGLHVTGRLNEETRQRLESAHAS